MGTEGHCHDLADTLEDRSIIITLQRKPKTAAVERLRKRDSEEFATLRRKAARWAADNLDKLTDPEPAIPDALNDRAADNWRPLLAIADLAGGDWPRRARDAACLLSGEHDDSAVNVGMLADIRTAFGDRDEMKSADLVAALVADPERPWAEWARGKPLTQKQLAGLTQAIRHHLGDGAPRREPHGKGYKRARFEEAWAAYCSGQNASLGPKPSSEACKRASADGMGTSRDFRSVQNGSPHGSKNANLSYSHAGLHACTDRNPESGPEGQFDQKDDGLSIPDFLLRKPAPNGGSGHRCDHCGLPEASGQWDWQGRPDGIWLHPRCEGPWLDSEGQR